LKLLEDVYGKLIQKVLGEIGFAIDNNNICRIEALAPY
jgi:hypothetical protein